MRFCRQLRFACGTGRQNHRCAGFDRRSATRRNHGARQLGVEEYHVWSRSADGLSGSPERCVVRRMMTCMGEQLADEGFDVRIDGDYQNSGHVCTMPHVACPDPFNSGVSPTQFSRW